MLCCAVPCCTVLCYAMHCQAETSHMMLLHATPWLAASALSNSHCRLDRLNASMLVLCRERDAGAYGTPAYYTAVLLFDIVPMRVVPPLFFALFSYWMIGLHTQCTGCLFTFIGGSRTPTWHA